MRRASTAEVLLGIHKERKKEKQPQQSQVKKTKENYHSESCVCTNCQWKRRTHSGRPPRK